MVKFTLEEADGLMTVIATAIEEITGDRADKRAIGKAVYLPAKKVLMVLTVMASPEPPAGHADETRPLMKDLLVFDLNKGGRRKPWEN